MIEIRRAKYEDKPRIVEISSKIWDGDDYLPQIFDKWVEEKGGEFSVITVDGVVAGCSKITQLPQNTLWLEGIRVDADYRGQGLGKKLAEYQLKRAEELGYTNLELGTFVENYESIAIIEKRGFERIASFKFLFKGLTADNEESNESVLSKSVNENVRKITNVNELNEVLKHIDTPSRQNYINLDWTFLKCDQNMLQQMIDRGLIYKYKTTLFAFGNWNQKDDGATLYFIFGEEKEVVLEFLLDSVKERGCSNIITMLSEEDSEYELYYNHGFESITAESKDAFVYRMKK